MILDFIIAVLCMSGIWKLTNCRAFPSPQFLMILGFFLYFYLGVILNSYDPFFAKNKHFDDIVTSVRLGFCSIALASIITCKWQSLSFDYYQRVYLQQNTVVDRWTLINLKVLAWIMVLLVLAYLVLIPEQPLLVMFTNPSQLVYAREAVTAGFKYFGFFSNFFYNIMPLIWISLFIAGKKKFAIILIFLNFVAILSTGQKSPVVYMLLLSLCTVGFLKGQFNYRKTIIYSLLGFIFLIGIVYVQNSHLFTGFSLDSLLSSMNGLIRRIFFVGPDTFLSYFKTFPSHHPFLIEQASEYSAHSLVYRTIYGNDVAGTVNSTSFIFFYGWFGNLYISAVLYFFVCILLFSTPYILRFLHASKYVVIANYIAIFLLVVKFNITDWYTIYFVYFLSFCIVHGFTYSSRFMYMFVKGDGKYKGTYFSVIITTLLFFYYLQGQLRVLLLG